MLATSWVRELKVMDALSTDVECYRALACPSLMLMGSRSPEHPLLDSSRALAKALPGVRVVTLEGLDHVAMRTGPELVAHFIAEFFAQ
jgi:pimeloyl-ACP methyl ester carboxylesterase